MAATYTESDHSGDEDLDDAFLESDLHERRKGSSSVSMKDRQQQRLEEEDQDEEEGEGEEEYDDNNYFEEDDFESYGEAAVESKIRHSPIIKPKNQLSSVGGMGGTQEQDEDSENIFDEDEGGQGQGGGQGGGEEENVEEIDFEQQSMTLESYMEEFFRKKYEKHNVKEGEDDPTPDAVDPTVSLSLLSNPSHFLDRVLMGSLPGRVNGISMEQILHSTLN